MARRTILAAIGGVMAGALAVTGLVSVAAPSDPCESAYTKPMNSTEKLKRYEDCRFDRIDKALASTSPEPSASPSAPASPSETPTATPEPTATPSVTPSASATPSDTPSPSVSQTPTQTPSATPSPVGDWPGAANTGVPAGTTLTASGGLTITQAGTVVDGRNITGNVVVRAANVTIRNSRIQATGAYCVQVASGNLTLEDSEIVGGCENAIAFDNWTAKRVEIRGTYGDGVKLGSNVNLIDSWIHDLVPASGAHADGGQVQNGITNTVVRHNTIDLGTTNGANAALFIAPDLGPTTNGPLVVDNNKLNGGNYVLYCVDGNNGQYLIRNITITNNRFGDKFAYGRANVNVPITQSGNVIDRTGASLTL